MTSFGLFYFSHLQVGIMPIIIHLACAYHSALLFLVYFCCSSIQLFIFQCYQMATSTMYFPQSTITSSWSTSGINQHHPVSSSPIWRVSIYSITKYVLIMIRLYSLFLINSDDEIFPNPVIVFITSGNINCG